MSSSIDGGRQPPIPRPKWIAPKLDVPQRRTVVAKSDALAVTHLSIRIALLLSVMVLAASFCNRGQWGVTIALTLASGFMWNFLGWAGISHEFFHGTVFSNKRLNRLLFRVFSVLSWSNYGYFELSHWLHHKYTRFDVDPESRSDDPIAWTSVPWLLTIDLPGLLKQISILVRNSFGFIPDGIAVFANVEQRRSVRVGAIAVLAFQMTFAIAAVTLWQPVLLFLVTLGPFTFSLPKRILELAQHKGAEHNVNDFRLNSRTVVLPKFLSFLYANMNYHVEHHLMPAVPYYRLPRLRNLLLTGGYKRLEDDLDLAGAVKLAFTPDLRSGVPI